MAGIALLLLLARPARAAESFARPDDYFHGGAMRYFSNNIPAALDVASNGLQQFPNDEKLKKLEALLKQQQNQQNQQQDQQKSEDQKKQDQQKKDQSKQDDKQKEPDKKDQKKSEEQKEKDKQDEQKKAEQPKSEDQKKPEEQQQAEPAQSKEMTPEQARRVLDTTKGDEKVLPIQMEKPPQTDKKLKDW